MKKLFMFLSFSIVCMTTAMAQNAPFVKADDIVNNLNAYISQFVETEGQIAHYCYVEGKKMKLQTEGNQFIKLIPADFMEVYDTAYTGKKVRIVGQVREERIYAGTLDEFEKNQNILCHVDHTPCQDTAWVNKKIEAGLAEELSKTDIQKLRNIMKETGKNYVSVVVISTFHVVLAEENEN